MHRNSVLKILVDNTKPVHISQFEKELNIKERSIREAIHQLKKDGEKHQFKIQTIRKQGYLLKVLNQNTFDQYLNTKQDTSTNKLKREFQIIYYLLQQNDFTTIQKLTEFLNVSRNTIISDLKEVNKTLQKHHLILNSKSHHGLKISGDEYHLRNAFCKFVINSPEYTKTIENYFQFIEKFEDKDLIHFLKDQLKNYQISVSSDSFHSIIEHIKILIYRVKQNNFIKALYENHLEIPKIYFDISKNTIEWIEKNFNIKIPNTESLYLASQISGRTLIKDIPLEEKEKIEKNILDALYLLDEEFLTDFSKDEKLKTALLMHLYPLWVRVTYKVRLNNPLIDMVSSRYASVFLVAIRFVEYVTQNINLKVSKDEMGYIAIHFAGHLERKKYRKLNDIRNILLISEIGRGNVLLNQHKLESIFPNANIEITSFEDVNETLLEHSDLVLSSKELTNQVIHQPFLIIPEILQDEDLSLIRELAILRTSYNLENKDHNIIYSLFDQRFFKIIDEGDYLEEITQLSEVMIKEKVADPHFALNVLEREKRFSTIYTGGVAGPHSLILNAIQQSLGVIIVRKNMSYQEKDVHIIFLINIHQGNLFLYREISRFIMAVMSDSQKISEVKKVKNYTEFLEWFLTIKY